MSRELDAKVAEKVFGYTGIGYYGPPAEGNWAHLSSRCFARQEDAEAAAVARFPHMEGHNIDLCYWKEDWGPLFVPYYTKSASDDYQVLKHVRENWNRAWKIKFHYALERSWLKRGPDEFLSEAYEPGDYSKAALAAIK